MWFRFLSKGAVPLIAAVLLLAVSCTGPVKEPSVAGTFYPAESEELQSMVDEFLKSAESAPHEGRLISLISPHAGYVFSGQVAAHGYKNLKGKDTIILIGPSHYASFTGASVYTEGSFKTPLGLVKINERLAKRLLNEKADVKFYPEAYEKEHSLEVQLPFLQTVLKRFRIVPVVIGSPTRETFEHLSVELARILKENKNAVIIASTDLSHFHNYKTAVEKDGKMMDALLRLSPAEAKRLLGTGQGEMCGTLPVLLTLDVAQRLGANEGVFFKYSNSGHVTGDLDRVVGYASMGIYKNPLTDKDKMELLGLARATINQKIKTGDATFAETTNTKLRADAAVFVTITRKGQLRGCIGQTSPTMPLYQAVQYSAMRSCASDPRFPPMTEQELGDIEIEISILSPFERVDDPNSIKVGRDGLYIRKGMNAGLLLPQVPVERGWDRNTYLAQLCQKAGLPEDGWKEGATIHRFGAVVFKDH
jgi:AmmeMemoRadiSam system protein B/AmmeMemoRadiSam system protein A